MEVSNVSNEAIFILVLVSMAIWVKVSREAVKPSKEINWWKMITLLSAGSLSTLVITLTLFQGMSL
jgi:predicted CDP-diglyceride synthetase/phosphatidate cytidylyltransferase